MKIIIYISVIITSIFVIFLLQPKQIASSNIIIKNPKVRFLSGVTTGAGYMIIKNTGKKDDELIGAEANFAKTTEIHDHLHTTEGFTKMVKVESIKIPAGEIVELKRGGKHIMFFHVDEEAKKSNQNFVTLYFKNAGKSTLNFELLENR